jgi:hypothetical protein
VLEGDKKECYQELIGLRHFFQVQIRKMHNLESRKEKFLAKHE